MIFYVAYWSANNVSFQECVLLWNNLSWRRTVTK